MLCVHGRQDSTMEPRKTYHLYADLYENGRKLNIRDLDADEQNAVLYELEDLWMDTYQYDAYKCSFRAAVSRDDDDIYVYYEKEGYPSAMPEDCLTRELTIGAPKVNEQTLQLVGDRIPLRLPGYPGRRLEVLFSDI
jgi:hypothetical protein